MTKRNENDEGIHAESLGEAGDGSSRRALLKQVAMGAGALVAISLTSPNALAAGRTAPGQPQSPSSAKLDPRIMLKSLEKAGLNPKELDLAKLLGNRSDIAELNSLLHGAAAGRKAEWPPITIVLYQA